MSISNVEGPALVAHADWSAHAAKRWLAQAHRQPAGRYRVGLPEPVRDVSILLQRLRSGLYENSVLLAGFDFPIGLPLAYARHAGISRFLDWLPLLGRGKWTQFHNVAALPDEITLQRPFYPRRPGGTRQSHLLQALGMKTIDDLRRRCDMPRDNRRAAAPLFWTMGAQQVGKATISGWRDVLTPALRDPTLNAALWPFAGSLVGLLASSAVHTILVEAYPGGYYAQLGLSWRRADGRRVSKRSQGARRDNAAALLNWTGDAGIDVEPELREAIRDGFGDGAAGEDQFDALVGLLGMLDALRQDPATYEPQNDQIRRIEGWIFGLPWLQD